MKIQIHKNQNFEDIAGSAVLIKSFKCANIYADEYLSWLRDREVLLTLNLTSYLNKPVDVDEVEQYCCALLESKNHIFCSIHERQTDLFIGTCKIGDIDEFSGVADIGIMIGEKRFWGKGIGCEAMSHCLICIQQVVLAKLTGGAMASNKPMLSIFDRLGFVKGVKRNRTVLGLLMLTTF